MNWPCNPTLYNSGQLTFNGNASAGNADVFNYWQTTFNDSSSAGNSTITNGNSQIIFNGNASAGNSHIYNNNYPGQITFNGSATAGNSRIYNGGNTTFNGNSSAGTTAIKNYWQTTFNANSTAGNSWLNNSWQILFNGSATAGSALIENNNGQASGGYGGNTTFNNNSSAGSALIKNYGGNVTTITSYGGNVGAYGGFVNFNDSSSAGSASITNYGGNTTLDFSGDTSFYNTSSAGSANITNSNGGAGGGHGGYLLFNDSSNASNATISNSGGNATGNHSGHTTFKDSSSAGSSTLIASGGTNGGFGGRMLFLDSSDGGTARVVTNGNGFLDISGLSTGGMNLGSIEGNGNIFLGGKALDVGGNSLNTTFSGAIQDGSFTGPSGVAGALSKTGSGTLILSGTNAYTGSTTVVAGTLQIGNGGTSGSIGSTSSITNNGTLAFNRSNTLTQGTDFASAISGTGDVTQLGSGTTILSGANTYTGITTASAGILQVAKIQALYNGDQTNWTADNLIVQAGATLALNVGRLGEFTDADVATICGLGNATGGFLPGSKLGIDTTNAGGSFTCNGVISNTNSGANSIGLTKLGTGTLILTAAPAYTGPTTVLGGSLQIDAPFTVRASGLAVAGGATMSVATLTATSAPVSVASGGALSVGGAFTATSTQLIVDGTLTSPTVTLIAASTLSGTGTLYGDLINSSGTVAPGHSPGTLTVNGNFTHPRNGTFQLQIGNVNWFDQLNVSGRASVGGTLQVQNWEGNALSYGQQYAFLHAGSITGSFDNITMPDASIFRGRFLVDGGVGSLLIAPASYALVAKDANQRSLARALDHFIPQIRNDREAVSAALDQLTAKQYPYAFNAISPAFYEILNSLTIEQANAQTQMLAQRFGAVRLGLTGFQSNIEAAPIHDDNNSGGVMDARELKNVFIPGPDNHWGVWLQGSGIFSSSANLNQLASTRSESGAMLGGIDYRMGDRLTMGLYSGYQGTCAQYANSSKLNSNGVLFGGYANCYSGGFYSNMIIGGGYTTSSVQRDIAFSTVHRTARSAPTGSQFLTYLDFGYDWTVKSFTFGPILSAQYNLCGNEPPDRNRSRQPRPAGRSGKCE